MATIEAKHPRAIRWFHWVNFPILSLMIWSGVLIYWANDVYVTLPGWFYGILGAPYRLADGMAYHFFLMWIFALNGIGYVLYTALSGEWRHLLPGRATLQEAWQVVLFDLGISKVHPPVKKFNGAQQIAYTSIIVMGFGSLVTGLAIYKPIQFGWLTSLLGGYKAARLEHFLLTVGYVGFFFVHIAQVVRAGWNNFRAMICGYEVKA
jgi:thiosulfate reductase cytochrome b subunit